MSEITLKRLLTNASILLSGNVVGGGIDALVMILTARALGVDQLGKLALIQASVMIVDRLVNFQSWQAMIKYGTSKLAKGEMSDFKSLLKFGFIIDIGSAIIGTIIALVSVRVIGDLYQWDAELIDLASLYSFIILFHVTGTPTAILRMFDKFKTLATAKVISSFIFLVGVLLAIMINGNLQSFIIYLLIANLASSMLLIYLSIKNLRERSLDKIFNSSLKNISQKNVSLWKFILTTNANRSFMLAVKEVDVLIVGWMLGSSATGLYKIAKQGTNAISKLLISLSQAAYPDLSKLWENFRFNDFRHIILRASLLMTLVGVSGWFVFFIFGKYLLNVALGYEYIAAYWTIVWYLLGTVFALAALILPPALLAIGRPQTILKNHIITTCIYFIGLYVLIKTFGLPGAGMAYLVYYVAWLILFGISTKHYINKALHLKNTNTTLNHI